MRQLGFCVFWCVHGLFLRLSSKSINQVSGLSGLSGLGPWLLVFVIVWVSGLWVDFLKLPVTDGFLDFAGLFQLLPKLKEFAVANAIFGFAKALPITAVQSILSEAIQEGLGRILNRPSTHAFEASRIQAVLAPEEWVAPSDDERRHRWQVAQEPANKFEDSSA